MESRWAESRNLEKSLEKVLDGFYLITTDLDMCWFIGLEKKINKNSLCVYFLSLLKNLRLGINPS